MLESIFYNQFVFIRIFIIRSFVLLKLIYNSTNDTIAPYIEHSSAAVPLLVVVLLDLKITFFKFKFDIYKNQSIANTSETLFELIFSSERRTRAMIRPPAGIPPAPPNDNIIDIKQIIIRSMIVISEASS